jgi:hypothetical protein
MVEAICYTSWKVTGSNPDEAIEFFPIYLIFPAALGPNVYSAFNINEYQKQKINVSGSRALSERKADNLTAIYEPNV